MEEELQEATRFQALQAGLSSGESGARQLLCRQLRQGSGLQCRCTRVGSESKRHQAMQLCESAHGSSELTQSEHGASATEGLGT